MEHNRKVARGRRRRQKSSQWIVGAVIGGVILVVAALALALRQNSPAGQTKFDSEFEPEVSGAPRVEVLPGDVIDYGDVKLDTTVTTEYRVRNVGDETLLVFGEPRVELVEGC